MTTIPPLPHSSTSFLTPYLPNPSSPKSSLHLHTTLTYATSLDGHLAIQPGVQTHLSGLESKALTHFLRTQHDAILVGAGTAVADDPGLNCRLEDVTIDQQPRPVVLDPKGRWLRTITSETRVLKTAQAGMGKAPWVIVQEGALNEVGDVIELLKAHGGDVIYIDFVNEDRTRKFQWDDILICLCDRGIESLMIEGGGGVINDLLAKNPSSVNSVIIALAPVYLGSGGVHVSPPRGNQISASQPVARFKEVHWSTLGQDVVMAGRIQL